MHLFFNLSRLLWTALGASLSWAAARWGLGVADLPAALALPAIPVGLFIGWRAAGLMRRARMASCVAGLAATAVFTYGVYTMRRADRANETATNAIDGAGYGLESVGGMIMAVFGGLTILASALSFAAYRADVSATGRGVE